MRKVDVAGACLVLAASALGCGMPALGQPSGADDTHVRRSVEADASVRSGVLPNGMRYFVRQSASPAGELSLRLGFEVGSIDESDSERGFAHFVEHLAFRQTRSAPQGGLDSAFARLGVDFGRDLNAETSQFATAYQLDFNSANAAGTHQGFGWLRDVADGVIFSPSVIASEHGVVISEQVEKADEARRVSEALAKFHGPELRSTVRSPDGLSRSLSAVTEPALRSFYERWYRPENAVLVAVGDQPVVALEQLVRAHFTTWRGRGAPAPRAPLGRVNLNRGLDAMTLAAPSLPKSATACRMQGPPAAGDEMSRLTREIHRSIWSAIYDQRMKRLVNGGSSSLLGAGVSADENKEYSTTCIVSLPTGDEWQKALAAAQSELLRLARDGPTEAELEVEVEAQRAKLRGAISNARARTTSQLAEVILDRALNRRTVTSSAEAMHAFNVAVEYLDVTTIKSAVNADWAGAGPFLTLMLPTKVEMAALRESWLRNAQGAALPAYADVAASSWPYEDFGKAGTVVGREQIDRPGFTRIRFSNGAILNFKRVTTQTNDVELRVRFGAGRKQIANQDFAAAMFGSAMFAAGGLGRMSAADIERSLRNVSWDFDFGIGNEAFEFSQSSISENLPSMLKVFAAYISDPGFRGDADVRIPDSVDLVLRNMATDPEIALSEAMTAAIDPGNPQLLPSREQLVKLKSADFARVLKGPITSEAIEVTIAGDTDEATAVRLVGGTFGALPVRRYADNRRADVRFLRFPNHPLPVIRARHHGEPDRAAARLMWPLYIASPERRREEYSLQLLAAIFDDAFRNRIRAELGKTYSPKVLTHMPDHADQGFLAADFASQPGDVERLVSEAKALAATLVSGRITSEQVEAVRQPLLSNFAARREKHSWWAAAMSGSARRPEITEELMQYESIMKSVTLEDVKAAAAKWLSAKPIVGIAVPGAVDELVAGPPSAGGEGSE
ncbi:MAG: insulinase family protein [Pseudomonadota bacterium]|nr:insulinase family protein [Pseudomonadota bacterium]